MTTPNQSPLLTHAVDFSWDDLKAYSQSGFKSAPPVPLSQSSKQVSPSAPGLFQPHALEPLSAPQAQTPQPVSMPKITADDPVLIAAVAAAAKKELDLVIEMTLQNAESKIRNELQRHLVDVAKKAIEQALAHSPSVNAGSSR